MELALSILPGIAVAAAAYVLYIAATKGVPAAWAMVKGWWTKAKNDLASAKADVADLKLRVAALEAKAGIEVHSVSASSPAVASPGASVTVPVGPANPA